MKKIISAIIILSILASQAVLAAPSLMEDYIFSDGEYLYTFGTTGDDEFDEAGITVGGKDYSVKSDYLPWVKATGKFGIGIKDSANILGESYQVTPYIKSNGETVSGEAVTVSKYEPLRNLKYHGPVVADFDSEPVLGESLKTGVQIYTNVDVYLMNNVHGELKGEQYISIFNPSASTVSSEIKTAWTTSSTMEWISFDLYESAVVKVFTKDTYSALTNEANGFTHHTTEDNNGAYFTLLHKEYPNADQTVFANMYAKEYSADNGCVRVSLPNLTTYGGLSHWGYLIVIDYIDDEEIDPEITNVSYAGPQVEGVEYGVKLNHILSSDNEKMVYANNSELSFANVDSSIEGNPYIIMDNVRGSSYNSEIAAAWFGSARDWITFEINSDATIKVITDGDTLKNCTSYGFTKSEEEVTYFETYNNTWDDSDVSHNVMYYKNVEVEPGETVKVTIPNAPTWTNQASCKKAHIVVIDFEKEYVLPEIQPEITNVSYAGPVVEGVEYGVKLKHLLTSDKQKMIFANTSELSFANVDSSIAGNPYIIMDNVTLSSYNSEIAAGWYGDARDWITFEINSDATIKVITDGDTLKNCGNYGFTKSEEEVTYFETYNNTWDKSEVSHNVMYYKKVEVEYGKTVKVTIPNAPTWTTQTSSKKPHVVVIDFDKEYILPEIQPEITNVSYVGPEIEGAELSAELITAIEENGKAYTDSSESVVFSIDSSIAGKPCIIMNQMRGIGIDDAITAWDQSEKDWISFDINKSAVIRIFSDGKALANCTSYDYELSEDVKTYLKTSNADYKYMYSKTVDVEYEKTSKVVIPNAPVWYGTNCRWGHIVVVDFID